jgi:HD-GYP domain-containing protein (c-di-GMP phosphodiesterase class II)
VSQNIYAALAKLTDIAVALSAEKDKKKLFELILTGARELTHADGGTLYLVEGDHLNFEIVQNQSLKFNVTSGGDARFTKIPLKEGDKPNDRMVAAYVANHRKTINIADAYSEAGFDFSGTRSFDEKNGYRSKSFLTVALINHEDDVIGVLQLINAKDEKGEIVPFTAEDQLVAEALASQAAVALTNQMLIRGLKNMFESLTRVIAEAIDEKSPITGKHCKRVPIIAHMLAEAAGKADNRYKLTEEQIYELDIAALLHDCGKVTTPVHVVEKGQKLQTIIDRITLIETRIEIAFRDKEIAALKGDKSIALDAVKEAFKKDVAFLRQSNLGAESMSEEALKRIDALSAITWTDIDGNTRPLITDDEKYNLKIVKGTLTPEERKIIENHAAMTIRMLSQIPYPKYLKDVTEIAGSHHERIDGKGYPRQLTGDQMSDRAKMLAIADVFEALTAPDRPYKEVMPLSRAIAILTAMSEEGHIDKTLWQLFLKEKVYLDYGKKHLRPEQMDVS